MKYCSNCGAELNESAKFCQACGQAVAAPAAPAPAEEVAPAEPQVAAAEPATPAAEPAAAPATAPKAVDFKQIVAKIKELAGKALPFLKKHLKAVIAIVVVIAIVIAGIVIYNETHCSYGSCKNASVDDSDYCDTHKCNICSSAKAYDSNYCYYHKYLYEGSSSSSSSTGSATRDLSFTNIKIQHNSLYTVVTGTVTNNGTRNYKFVTIKGSFKTSTGTVVDTDSTYAVGSEGLAKGESTTFRMSVDKNTSIRSCSISIISYK